MKQPETTAVNRTDSVFVGADHYGLYYPEDGTLVGGYLKDEATAALAVARSYRGSFHTGGAYIVKYSIERVED